MQDDAELGQWPAPSGPGATPSAPRQRRVLLVDDSPVAREKIGGVLRDLGCTVLLAVDGVEGLRQLKEHAEGLDLVVLDVQMPRMDGITALRHMRQLPALAAVPIVMLTTRSDKDTVRTALAQKANDYIRKDAAITAIAERLSVHLGAPRGAVPPAAVLRDPELATEAARRILGARTGEADLRGRPWVLFYEGRSDLQDMVSGKNSGLVRFYATAVGALGQLRRVYPGIDLSYGIEHDRQVVNRLAKEKKAPTAMLVVSGRQAEGMSVARMTRFVCGRHLPIYLVCESAEALPADDRQSLKKTDITLLERRELDSERLQSLYAKHLLPEFLVTGSGLQYHELRCGSGPAPGAGQTVTVRCTGTLVDGTVCVDAGRGEQPCRFTLGQGQVVRAWEEGVALMRPGGRALVVAPPELAYGQEGDGNLVPPGATIVYDLELLEVGGAEAPREDPMEPAFGGDDIGDLLDPQDDDRAP